jgi:class 3 adenylate cyclase
MLIRTSVDAMTPTGTVTFLFTDIEGSTSRGNNVPSKMQPALERHDTILRQAIESSAGRVVKTTGDGMLAVFSEAMDSLSASLWPRSAPCKALRPPRLARAAGDEPLPLALKVRMGLHTGVADVREGDYFGTSVNRAPLSTVDSTGRRNTCYRY